MDPVLLSRIQFAFTVGFHYIFPPLTIGLAWLILWFQSVYYFKKRNEYRIIADFWLKLFGMTFAVGVATGITMEFQFGTNWANYSKFVGDIFGAPLAAEGIFAFFLESSFLGILLYGKDKISPKLYWISGLMVTLGSTFSAFWIIVANSWQQTPSGYVIRNGRAELVDFFAAVFNPSTIPRYLHTINGALISGGFFVMGISAYYLIKNKNICFAQISLKTSLIFTLLPSIFILPIGHYQAIQVAETQPTKLAAFEGLWESGHHAPLLLFGIPSAEQEVTKYSLSIPGGLSLLVGGSFATKVQGLKDFIKEERPPIALSFYSFHLMVILGTYFIMLTVLLLFLLWKKRLFENKTILRLVLYSIPLPIIANELGWIAAEVGRQPWIVQGLLKTKDAISFSVPVEQIVASLVFFIIVYAILFVLWIYLLKHKIDQGPEEVL